VFRLSHDVGANEAFFDLMKEKGVSWKDYRAFHVLVGFQKVDMNGSMWNFYS